MTEQTTPDQGDQNVAPSDETASTKPSRLSRLRSRVGGVGRGTVIGLVVGLVLGGGTGFAVGAVATGPGHGDRGHHGRLLDDGDGRGQRGFPPSGQPGRVPPTTPPEATPSPTT